MPDSPSPITRRGLLAGLGAGLLASASARALPAGSVTQWHETVDVVIAGSGAAGICAALEARAAGAEVLVLESLALAGGSSSLSGGVVYAGGGTALQRALGVEDSVEQMYAYLDARSSPAVARDKLQLYCERSAGHFDWLVAQGVPYSTRLATAKGIPTGDESLYVSGDELSRTAQAVATAAARGHVPGIAGFNGGKVLMAKLLARAAAAGIEPRTRVQCRQLVTGEDGGVLGLAADTADGVRYLRARRGVVLACGGFVHDRDMLAEQAPALAASATPWGGAGDLGQGIRMGVAAGAATLRLHEGFAIAPLYPPENSLAGIVVNAAGLRFITEDSYHGVLGHAIAYGQQGRAWLVTDQFSHIDSPLDNIPQVAESATIGGLEQQLLMPRGALQHTVAYYNRYAARGADPMFNKASAYVRPVSAPPFRAWDLSPSASFMPVHTLGGLKTGLNGEVFNSFGEPIPGLYAAGRTSAGVPGAPYLASGLSLGDASLFGRRAGRVAAGGAPL